MEYKFRSSILRKSTYYNITSNNNTFVVEVVSVCIVNVHNDSFLPKALKHNAKAGYTKGQLGIGCNKEQHLLTIISLRSK